MKYRDWNYEKTILIECDDGLARPAEPIDVRLAVETAHASTLDRDVRIVLKHDWNRIDREINSQVYDIVDHGEVTTFRVAFTIDLPGHGVQRVGVYYDNPEAQPPRYESAMEVSAVPRGSMIETPQFFILRDPATGQLEDITLKTRKRGPRSENIFPIRVAPIAQQACGVVLARQGENLERVRDIMVRPILAGPMFAEFSTTGRLGSGEDAPILTTTHRFHADQPYALVRSRIEFPAETAVFEIRTDCIAADRNLFTHYTFRPVSPNLSEYDMEEMGHVLIAADRTADLPDGMVLGGFVPYDIAWHALASTRTARYYAVASINLSRTTEQSGTPFYRAATYLHKDGPLVHRYRAPVYVHKRDDPRNAIHIPAGAVYEDISAMQYGLWNDTDWGQDVDDLGRRLNNRPRITTHPRLAGIADPPLAIDEWPNIGRRADAYLRRGLR